MLDPTLLLFMVEKAVIITEGSRVLQYLGEQLILSAAHERASWVKHLPGRLLSLRRVYPVALGQASFSTSEGVIKCQAWVAFSGTGSSG